MKTRDVLAVFNRGRISSKALARTDVGRVSLSAEIQTNWMPRTLGSMMLRPGLGYKGECLDDGAILPFIYDVDDVALLELTPDALRIWEDGETLVSRASVDTSVANGNFVSDLTGWTNADDAGATSSWSASGMQLIGTGYNSARRRQQVSVSVADQGQTHALRIHVLRGSAILRIGSTAGADDTLRQSVLRTGMHSIAFTPGATSFWIELNTSLTYPVLIASVSVEGGGVLNLPTPWPTVDACKAVRWAQDGDVVFVAAGSAYQQRRIERRPNNGWSITMYETTDGPFDFDNTENITLTPSAISGAITIDASRSVFRSDQVNSLIRISSQGQLVDGDFTDELQFTNEVRVTGVDNDRAIEIRRNGTWSGTLSLQRSLGAPGSWTTVATYTANGTTTYDDGLDNSIAFYRIGFEAGNYGSGTAEVEMEYPNGSITGIVRITGFTSETQVSAIVLSPLGATEATEVWAEGAWSDDKGWPESVAIWEGRIWWQAAGRNYGSVSDSFASFDPDVEGEAAPINRQIGQGAIQQANWALPLQRLIIGTAGAEHAIRSNSFDEPVTSVNYNSKAPSTKGSEAIPASFEDGRGYFIDRTGRRLFEMRYSAEAYGYDAREMTLLTPEITESGVVRIATQQSPDMRTHCVKSDGSACVLVRDAAEDVLCWVDVETSGEIEDVIVLPGKVEDRVFYRVKRTVGGASVRYLEQWAREDQCLGADANFQADSYVTGTGPIAGLDHLEGLDVVIWADGQDRGVQTVSGGALTGTYSSWCVGLSYRARYKSAKLAGETRMGLSLTQRTRINKLGLVLENTHAQGLKYGPDFDVMDDLPLVENAADVASDAVWSHYDEDVLEFPGDWETDNRICLEANAPRPVTVLALVMNVDRQDSA